MEQQQKIEIGQRIRELRDASPHTNESIADHVGVGIRAVANWIAGSTGITYEHAKKVAALFGVDHRWLWDGRERSSAGDLLDALSEREAGGAVSRIEGQIESLRAELLAEIAALRSAQEGTPSRRGRGGRGSGASRS